MDPILEIAKKHDLRIIEVVRNFFSAKKFRKLRESLWI